MEEVNDEVDDSLEDYSEALTSDGFPVRNFLPGAMAPTTSISFMK